MPTYQDSIAEVYPETQVQVIALNHDAPLNPSPVQRLRNYVNYIGNLSGYQKTDTLDYPMVYDASGTIFNSYNAGSNLPGIFLIDQTGKIRLRYDGASTAPAFWPEFNAIMDTTRWLLDHPPSH